MNRKLFLALLALTMFIAIISCDGPEAPQFPEGYVDGLRPIYFTDAAFSITKKPARSINRAGKIYSYGNTLLINEVNEGIHVIDNTNPSDPKNLYFIDVPGNTDIAMKEGLIYANNLSDLAVIRVYNEDFEVLQHISNVFMDEDQQQYPVGDDVYFECVDDSKGRVIGWRPSVIDSPDCYKP